MHPTIVLQWLFQNLYVLLVPLYKEITTILATTMIIRVIKPAIGSFQIAIFHDICELVSGDIPCDLQRKERVGTQNK